MLVRLLHIGWLGHPATAGSCLCFIGLSLQERLDGLRYLWRGATHQEDDGTQFPEVIGHVLELCTFVHAAVQG